MGIVFAPFFQLFFDIGLRLGLAHVVGELVRCIFPVICDKIVHMYGVPD